MKKLFRHSAALAILAVTAGALSSCGGKRHEIEFWGSFGASYSQYLESVVKDIKEKKGYDIRYTTKGSYPGILEAVTNSISTSKYPNLLTGYPDHFATYLGNKILVPLNDYVAKYEQEHGMAEGELLADYYDDYMAENWDLDIVKNASGGYDKALTALPFNKSTELMGYNGTFVDYCGQLAGYEADDLGHVPATWQEWTVKGPKYREILNSLVKKTDGNGQTLPGGEGKILYFDQSEDGSASNFSFEKGSRQSSLDFTNVDIKQTRIITWDSTDNMFITLIRQWGSEYTHLDDDQKLIDPRIRVGEICFNSSKNRAKSVECLDFFNQLNAKNIFGIASQLGGKGFSSDAFAANKVMFMLCSSGGLSYNTDGASWMRRFRVAPLPYYDDGTDVSGMSKEEAEKHVRKYVISQGADIAMTDYGALDKSFDTMIDLTRGEYQARWCLNTGYYPCSKSATETDIYQEFLHDTSYSDPTTVAYREGSQVNEEHYMDENKNWTKFVDPAFRSSSTVRTEVAKVFVKVFSEVKLDAEGLPLSSNKATYESILKDTVDAFKNDDSVNVLK